MTKVNDFIHSEEKSPSNPFIWNLNEIVVRRVFGTSMVEEYEEIADSQYQSERQELFDEDYGKWL